MRKLALVLVGVLVGGAVGALGLHVGLAAEPQADTLVVCQRPGADLRSPASNGTCPSGYTKTEITETPPAPTTTTTAPPTTVPPTRVTAFHRLSRDAIGGTLMSGDGVVTSLTLQAGAYELTASGSLSIGASSAVCKLQLGSGFELDDTYLHTESGGGPDHRTLHGVFEDDVQFDVVVWCGVLTGPGAADALHTWQLTATRIDDVQSAI
jgi:hypothetical protein